MFRFRRWYALMTDEFCGMFFFIFSVELCDRKMPRHGIPQQENITEFRNRKWRRIPLQGKPRNSAAECRINTSRTLPSHHSVALLVGLQTTRFIPFSFREKKKKNFCYFYEHMYVLHVLFLRTYVCITCIIFTNICITRKFSLK